MLAEHDMPDQMEQLCSFILTRHLVLAFLPACVITAVPAGLTGVALATDMLCANC